MNELLRAQAALEILRSAWNQHLHVPRMIQGGEDELDICEGPRCAWCHAYKILLNRIEALDGFVKRVERWSK